MATSLKKRGYTAPNLSDKKRKFCHEYVVDYNATAAALRAGYAQSTAKDQSYKLVRDPAVQAYLRKIEREELELAGLRKEVALKKLLDTVYRDYKDLSGLNGQVVSTLEELPDRAHAWIDGFDVTQQFDPETGALIGQRIKIKCVPNATAQDMLLRVLDAYAASKHEHEHKVDFSLLLQQAPVVVDAELKELEELP